MTSADKPIFSIKFYIFDRKKVLTSKDENDLMKILENLEDIVSSVQQHSVKICCMLVHKFIIIIKKYFELKRNMADVKENEKLREEVSELKKEIETLKEHLKKYTAPTRYKKYYEQNKEKIIEQKKEYNKSKKNEKN